MVEPSSLFVSKREQIHADHTFLFSANRSAVVQCRSRRRDLGSQPFSRNRKTIRPITIMKVTAIKTAMAALLASC
jgi:hypothetical protein